MSSVLSSPSDYEVPFNLPISTICFPTSENLKSFQSCLITLCTAACLAPVRALQLAGQLVAPQLTCILQSFLSYSLWLFQIITPGIGRDLLFTIYFTKITDESGCEWSGFESLLAIATVTAMDRTWQKVNCKYRLYISVSTVFMPNMHKIFHCSDSK